MMNVMKREAGMRTTRVRWGLNPQQLKTLYEGLIVHRSLDHQEYLNEDDDADCFCD